MESALKMAGRVAGKLALITGGAQGLGAAQGRMLAREGARVMLAHLGNGNGDNDPGPDQRKTSGFQEDLAARLRSPEAICPAFTAGKHGVCASEQAGTQRERHERVDQAGPQAGLEQWRTHRYLGQHQLQCRTQKACHKENRELPLHKFQQRTDPSEQVRPGKARVKRMLARSPGRWGFAFRNIHAAGIVPVDVT